MSLRWIPPAALGILCVFVATPHAETRPVIATPDALPAPVVDSTVALDPALFNAEIQAAMTAGKSWPRNPYLVILRRLHLGLEADQELPRGLKLEVTGDGRQSPDLLSVTAILDGLHDDSIAAIRQTMELRRQEDGSWKVAAETAAYRCARGGRMAAFSGEPCP